MFILDEAPVFKYFWVLAIVLLFFLAFFILVNNGLIFELKDSSGLFLFNSSSPKVQSISFSATPSVERQLPDSVLAGSEFDVNLIITLPDVNQAFLIDDAFPAGFVLVNARDGNSYETGHLKWVDYNSSSINRFVSYRLKAPSSVGEFSFVGYYVFEDLIVKQISGASILRVRVVGPCDGLANGVSCGDNNYCCGGICVASPANCPLCQKDGNCCSGTSAVCCNEPVTAICGSSACPASSCSGAGINYWEGYDANCNKFCNGNGSCADCSCVKNLVDCGNSKVCNAVLNGCVSCESGKLNCDLDSLNGCETISSDDRNNCGACNKVCASDEYCETGVCKKAVSGPLGDPFSLFNIGSLLGSDWANYWIAFFVFLAVGLVLVGFVFKKPQVMVVEKPTEKLQAAGEKKAIPKKAGKDPKLDSSFSDNFDTKLSSLDESLKRLEEKLREKGN